MTPEQSNAEEEHEILREYRELREAEPSGSSFLQWVAIIALAIFVGFAAFGDKI